MFHGSKQNLGSLVDTSRPIVNIVVVKVFNRNIIFTCALSTPIVAVVAVTVVVL